MPKTVPIYDRITLPPRPKPKPREAMATRVLIPHDLAKFVHDLRTALSIRQIDVATRAGVSRQWIGELESGKPTCEIEKVMRTLETLGFEITLTPLDPPPPWMLRAVAAAHSKSRRAAEGRRMRRNGRRAMAREARLAANAPGEPPELG